MIFKEIILNSEPIKFYNITLVYTFKCNARCAHCLYECGPERNERLSIEIIKRILKNISKMGINNFTLTGGEPFLFMSEIEEILLFANSLDLKCLIGTNGFWGTSYENALNILQKLYSLGLRKLLLSADKYHQEFIEFQRLINILKAAETIGLKVKITVNMTKEDKENIEIIQKLKSFNCTISLKEPKLVGRAIKNVNEADLYTFILTDRKIRDINNPCNQIGLPAITPDGRVWVCCGIPSSRFYHDALKKCPLMWGNIYYDSLETILNKAKDDPILKILKVFGPLRLIQIIEESDQIKYQFHPKYYRICDICCEILSSQKYLKIIHKCLFGEN